MVPESGQHGPEMRRIVFDASVELFDQHVPVRDPVGEAPPALIGPGQRERKIGFAAGQHLVEGTFQQPFAVAEPVMPVDEALDAVFAGHIRLRLARLGDPQVVIPQIGRKYRRALPTFVHSVKPFPHHKSFSGMGEIEADTMPIISLSYIDPTIGPGYRSGLRGPAQQGCAPA